MGSAGFTLADRLGAKAIPCSVAGCTRTWISMAGKQLKLGTRGAADPADPTSSMCDPCREKFAKLSDAARPCDRPGCSGTWGWSAMAQLEAFAGKRPPPAGMCTDCEQKLAALEDKAVPCSVAGCTRTSTFTRRAQLLLGAPEVEPTPPATMCAQCEGVFKKLKDRGVACGINGCKEKWSWSADEQIQAYAAGLPNEPPRRMCETCKAAFGGIADREVRCRTSGCKKTWTWTRGDQLDACLAGKPAPKAPHRMCTSCLEIYKNLKDVERPCRRSGCKGTWIDKRGAQLARAVRGKTGDPYPQYCESCEKELGDLEDRKVSCKTENCTGTWVWSKAAQLAAGVRTLPKIEEANGSANGATAREAEPPAVAPVAAEPVAEATGDEVAPTAIATATAGPAPAPASAGGGKKRRRKRRREIRPPERRCQTCIDFLKDRKTLEIPCRQCATLIYWPPESQLQTHLGAWAEPSLCGACKRDATEAARAAEREALRHGGVVLAEQHPAPEPPPAEAPAETAAPEAPST
jgi:hypothetical protein